MVAISGVRVGEMMPIGLRVLFVCSPAVPGAARRHLRYGVFDELMNPGCIEGLAGLLAGGA
jgi:hypothetical protein